MCMGVSGGVEEVRERRMRLGGEGEQRRQLEEGMQGGGETH